MTIEMHLTTDRTEIRNSADDDAPSDLRASVGSEGRAMYSAVRGFWLVLEGLLTLALVALLWAGGEA